MELNWTRKKIRIPLFKMLVVFTIFFFVYNDFNIRMIYGYALLAVSVVAYLVYKKGRIYVTKIKIVYFMLAVIVATLILAGDYDKNAMVFALGVIMCAIVSFVGDIRKEELISSIYLVLIAGTIMALYVIAVKINPSFYWTFISEHTSEQSQQYNYELLRDGYGVGIGASVTLLNYMLILAGVINANIIMAYRNTLKHRRLFLACEFIILVGLLLGNRKSELLSFFVALVFCFNLHMGWSTSKEKRKSRIRVCFLLVVAVIVLFFLAANGYLGRYTIFFERLAGNYQSSDVKVDVTSGRLVLWALALDLFLQNPLLGVGWGNFGNYVPASFSDKMHNVHNNYIQLLCETGVVGFFLVLVPMILLFGYTKTTQKHFSRKKREPLAQMCNASSYGLQIAFFTLSFLDPSWYKMSYWPFFTISIMLSNYSTHYLTDTKALENNSSKAMLGRIDVGEVENSTQMPHIAG